MKTITELNNRVWYRLIKVIFIFTTGLFTLFFTYLVYIEHKPMEVSDYKISCISGDTNKKTFYASKDAGLSLIQNASEDIYSSLSQKEKTKIKNMCDLSEEEVIALNKKYSDFLSETNRSELESIFFIEDNRPYKIEDSTTTKGSYSEAILYSIPPLLLIILFTELIRRVFYYIFLGSIRPKN